MHASLVQLLRLLRLRLSLALRPFPQHLLRPAYTLALFGSCVMSLRCSKL